jgi:hypothetical protein
MLLAVGGLRTVAQAAEARPAVLFVGVDLTSVRTWDDWLASGYELDARPIEAIKSVADLKPFNVVVIADLPPVDGEGKVTAAQLVFEQALDAYLKQGGGLIAFCTGSGFANTTQSLSHLLKPFGALVPEEQVTDPQHLFGSIGEYPTGTYTTQILDAPMTKGVKRIGYLGEASRADCIEMMMPVVFTDKAAWHAAVKGEQTAYSAEGLHPGSGPELKPTPATYAQSPILAAWREVGPGRMFVFPLNPSFTTGSPEVFLNVLWDRDDQTKPDALQDRTLIMNAVRWAAEPTRGGGVLGGFVTDRKIRVDQRAILEGLTAPIDWSKVGTGETLAAKLAAQRGLIGAQSTYSGGRATVAELCQAAKAAGLQFLGFTEKLESLNADSWEKLKAECAAQSDANFLALPGMLALDKVGNTWFGLGWVSFPGVPALTPDLQRIDNTYFTFARVFKGRLWGFAQVGRNPNPWFEMKQSSAFAVYTATPGQPLDNAEETYLKSCQDMENYLPFNVTVVDSAAAVAAAARGTVNIFTGPSVQALTDYARGEGASGSDLYWADPHKWYLSSGPQLVYNGGYNLGNLAVNEEFENVYRYGFKLAGLQAGDRIVLFDGTKPFREWRATGETFTAEHTWPHEQVRQYVLRVIRGGQTVLLAPPVTLHYGRRFMQCGDRQNTLPFNYQPDRQGNTYVSGIPIGAHYRSWQPATLVYGNFKIWLTGAVAVEYQPPMYMTFWTSPGIPFDSTRVEAGTSLAAYDHPALSCPGMIVVDSRTDRVYPNGGSNTGDCTPPKLTEPSQLFTLDQRRYGIYGMLDQLNGQFVESKITALQNLSLKNNSTSAVISWMSFPMKQNLSRYAEFSVGGKVDHYSLGELPTVHRADPLAPGDYFGMYPYGLAGGGAQYVVAGKLSSYLSTPNQNGMNDQISLTVPNQWKQGDTFSYKMLYTTGGSTPSQATSQYAQVVSFLGLKDGKFPAITKLTGGTLLPEPVMATVQVTPQSTVELETRQADDPLGLPFRLRGFSPNWQLVYLLNGSKTWRYCGQLDGDYFFHLYTNLAAYQVKIGHPLLSTRPELRITLDDPTGKQAAFEVYNPTDKPLSAILQANPAFLPEQTLRVTLAPYESQRLSVQTAP